MSGWNDWIGANSIQDLRNLIGEFRTFAALSAVLGAAQVGRTATLVNASGGVIGTWRKVGSVLLLQGKLDLSAVTATAPELAIGTDILQLQGSSLAWADGGLRINTTAATEQYFSIPCAGAIPLWRSVGYLFEHQIKMSAHHGWFGAGMYSPTELRSYLGIAKNSTVTLYRGMASGDPAAGALTTTSTVNGAYIPGVVVSDYAGWVSGIDGLHSSIVPATPRLTVSCHSMAPIDAGVGATFYSSTLAVMAPTATIPVVAISGAADKTMSLVLTGLRVSYAV